jgi:gamma-glutamylcyclotransferase (GGCT)/AIG2-like uncharacterized protein YtfP
MATASLTGVATVRGRLYSFGNYCALVPDDDASHVVKGEVYELGGASVEETLGALDEYEGLGPRTLPPQEYRRERVRATLGDGRAREAWAYVLNRSTEGLQLVESGDFVEWRRSRRQ